MFSGTVVKSTSMPAPSIRRRTAASRCASSPRESGSSPPVPSPITRSSAEGAAPRDRSVTTHGLHAADGFLRFRRADELHHIAVRVLDEHLAEACRAGHDIATGQSELL